MFTISSLVMFHLLVDNKDYFYTIFQNPNQWQNLDLITGSRNLVKEVFKKTSHPFHNVSSGILILYCTRKLSPWKWCPQWKQEHVFIDLDKGKMEKYQ